MSRTPESRASFRFAFALLGALSLFVVTREACAQDQNAAAAEVLFRDGRAAADRGDYQTACAKFHESNRLDPAVGTVFNIADCEEKLGHLATAWTSFQEVAQRLPTDDERRAMAATRAAALEPRLPRLRIRLATHAPPGASVRRDEVTLGAASLDTALPVDPGRHRVEVTAAGRPVRAYDVSLGEGETKTLEVQAAPAPVTRVELERPAASQHSGAKTAGYVIGSVGLVATLTGIVAGVLVLDKKHTVDRQCDADKRCTQAGLDAARSGKTLGVVTTVALATGAVGLGAGTYLLLSAGSSRTAGMQTELGIRGAF